MGVFPGFGVNYKAAQANWASDIQYFQGIGLNVIRPSIAYVPTPWAQGTPLPYTSSNADINAYWRLCAQTFAVADFYVSWGITTPYNPITSSNWSIYHDAVVAEAAYLQSAGIALGDFEIGNELELIVDGTTMTVAQLNSSIRQLAADVKAAYNLAPVSYGASLGSSSATNDWLNNGLGSLDVLSVHPYGSITPNTSSIGYGAFTTANTVLSTFGNRAYISETHVDPNSQHLELTSPYQQASWMNNILSTYILPNNTKFLAYSYVGYRNGDNQFALRNTDGSFSPVWWEFFESEPIGYNGSQPYPRLLP